MSYFQDIKTGIRTTVKGLSLTLKHLRNATKRRTPDGIASDNYFDLQNGLVTLQYPYEQLPIPDNGRYRLRNEIDDCIVCDKCAKICPVDCITIDAIKATEEVARASDGSPIRLYAATFDIDMAKCCYCGLCTVVCPTECLTMDKKFDYSEFELGKLTYEFSNLSPEQADEKRALYEQFLREKEAAKTANKPTVAPVVGGADSKDESPKRPVFRPTARPTPPVPADVPVSEEKVPEPEHPLTDATPVEMERIAQGGLETVKHPVFEPAPEPESPPAELPEDVSVVSEKTPAPKLPFRPTMKPKAAETGEEMPEVPPAISKPAGFRPTMKPALPKVTEPDALPATEPPAPKPAFRPTMKPTAKEPAGPPMEEPPKPAFKPTMKPVVPKIVEPETDAPAASDDAPLPKPKPAFRPTMKPKTNPDDDGQEGQKTTE